MYSARLASRLPPLLRRCLTTLPEEASMGETPHRSAKEASLPNLWGLSFPLWVARVCDGISSRDVFFCSRCDRSFIMSIGDGLWAGVG